MLLHSLVFQLLLITLLIFPAAARGQSENSVIIDESFSSATIGKNLDWLEDCGKNFTIKEVSSPAFSDRFRPSSEMYPNFGYTASRFWFRLVVVNRSGKLIEWFLKSRYPPLKSLILYVPINGSYRAVKSGRSVHYRERPYDNENYVFPVRQQPGKAVYYLSAESSNSAVFIPIDIYGREALVNSVTFETALNGMFYGIILIMFLYNLILFIFIRERIYFYYILYLFGIAWVLLGFDGLGNRFLWQDFPVLNQSNFAVFFVCYILIVFSKSLLGISEKLPYINRIITGYLIAVSTGAILDLILLDRLPQLAQAAALGSAIIGISAGLILFIKRERSAFLYISSWSFLMLGGTLRVVMEMNLLPFQDSSEFLLKGSISLQIVTFAVALADRFNLMRQDLANKYLEVETSRKKLALKNQELEATNEELQATSEEFEAQNEELISSQQDLAKSEELFRKIFETSPYAILITNAVDGRYIMVNDAFCQNTGYSKEDIIGKKFVDVGTIIFQEYNEKVVKELKAEGKVENFTAKGKKKNGEEFQALYSAIFIEFGGEPAVLSLAIDVTEKIKLEEQLNQTRKMEVVGQLAGGIAHDFNNMLAGILGNVDLLSSEYQDDKQAQKYISTIKESAHRAGNLIKKLLVFSRNQPAEKEIIDIHSVLTEAVSLLERGIHRNIELKFDWNAESGMVLGDITLLQNVFLNIGVNARDAMPEGGRLSFFTENVYLDKQNCRNFSHPVSPGDFIKIMITDTGYGISEDIIDRIFTPFFTTKETGKGTGLGLAMVYGTVLDHGGGFWLTVSLAKAPLLVYFYPGLMENMMTN